MIEYIIIGFLIAFFFDYINIILSYIIEWIKSIISIKIAQCNSKIAAISDEIEDPSQEQIKIIGFTISKDTQLDQKGSQK